MGTVSFKSGSEKGFSLIEVCIALIVISLLTLPLIQMWNNYIQSRKMSDTKSVLDITNSALIKYVGKYGHYPIPENPNSAMGTPAAGQSATIPAIGTAWPACTGADATVCSTSGAYPAGTTRNVLIGTIPYAALGIPYRSAMDGYGRKLIYAVTEELTAATAATVSTTYDESHGSIEVLGSDNASIYGDVALAYDRSHYFIGSHGEDGNGAYSFSGGRYAACGDATTGTDFENCNGDGTFRNNYDVAAGVNMINLGQGTLHFDDYTVTNNRSETGLWSLIPNLPNMRSMNDGNIAINVNTCPPPCVPTAHVQVGGDIGAKGTLKTSRFCPAGGNCREPAAYDPNYISGFGHPFLMTPEQIVDPPPESALPEETDINPLYTWDPVTQGHVGAGIRCVGKRPMIGITSRPGVDFSGIPDEYCAYSAAIRYASVWGVDTCPAGQYPRAVKFDGYRIYLTSCAPAP